MKEQPCELFNLIPREKIDHVFETSPTAGAELDYTFLGFENIYKAVTLFAPKDKVIIDFGCGYAFQSWYFRDYVKYIGVDNRTTYLDVLETDNSQFYFTSIQNFTRKIFPRLGLWPEDVFAICSYVPDREARKLVRETFPYCLVYYPDGRGLNVNQKPK